eukprot:3582710-Alexandrium_andersonii.AAC.1
MGPRPAPQEDMPLACGMVSFRERSFSEPIGALCKGVAGAEASSRAVSYTHLTLPTICSV